MKMSNNPSDFEDNDFEDDFDDDFEELDGKCYISY